LDWFQIGSLTNWVRKMLRVKKKKRDFELPKTCPLGHRDIEIVSVEEMDYIDRFTEREMKRFSDRIRTVKVYNGICIVFCKECDKEYEMECYIYEYGPWKKEE